MKEPNEAIMKKITEELYKQPEDFQRVMQLYISRMTEDNPEVELHEDELALALLLPKELFSDFLELQGNYNLKNPKVVAFLEN